MPARRAFSVPFLLLLVVVLFLAHLLQGTVALSLSEVWNALVIKDAADREAVLIVRGIRLPQAITALAAGAGLAVSGLLMQTLFRNPLAGPSVLGITSGASLGVAMVLLAGPVLGQAWWVGSGGQVAGAMLGAFGVLVLILLADRRVPDGITLLIIGLMVGYLCSAIISVLQVSVAATALKGFVLWGMGTFAAVPPSQLPWILVPVTLALLGAWSMAKPMDALLLGEDEAATLGVEVPLTRRRIMWLTGILAGTITAFCGPIAFLGLATPHVVRGLLRTNDHRHLIPATILCGGALALGCDLLSRLPGTGGQVPLNAVTSLLGAPVVAWVLLAGRRWARMT